jgi:hypothetical protein
MSKEILRPQKAQPAPIAHIVGEIDHAGKVWTPAHPAQEPAPVPDGFWLVEAMPSKLNLWPVTEAQLLALALAPVQEPVAWRYRTGTFFNREIHWRYIDSLEGTEKLLGIQPLYTTPPQRKALTDEQIEKCIEAADTKWADAFVSVEWARHLTKAIEAAHGIKE